MIHIFWSGKGFLVAVFTFGFSLMANLISNSITGGEKYWNTHKWPFAVSLFASAAACWFVGRFFRDRGAQVFIDPKTGKEVFFGQSHTLFFIPMMWWGPILAVLGLIVIGAEVLR